MILEKVEELANLAMIFLTLLLFFGFFNNSPDPCSHHQKRVVVLKKFSNFKSWKINRSFLGRHFFVDDVSADRDSAGNESDKRNKRRDVGDHFLDVFFKGFVFGQIVFEIVLARYQL